MTYASTRAPTPAASIAHNAREIDENPSLAATEKGLDLLTEFAVQRRLQGPLELKNREARARLQ